MNRQGFNNPLSPRGLLLILSIMALAVYLHFSQAPLQATPELIASNSVSIAKTKPPRSVEVDRSTNSELAATIPDAITTPVGLDPEAARSAVHQVENSVYQRATTMFEQETVDVEWAGAYEQSLRAMFAQHQGLQRVSINSISCHTSMCRIEVFTPRDADADFFTAMFYDGLTNFRAGELKAEAAITRRMEQGMTSVYVARKDHTLGFY